MVRWLEWRVVPIQCNSTFTKLHSGRVASSSADECEGQRAHRFRRASLTRRLLNPDVPIIYIYPAKSIPQKPNPVMPLAGFTLPCMEMSINHQLYKPHWPRTECRVFRKPLHRSTARDPKDATTLWTMSARRVCDINYANVARLTDRYTIIEQTDYNQGELVL